jgi:AcrR family transcriptional regulator
VVTRHPDQTRQTILEAAFWEMYRNGYQGASVDRILEGTGLTKGALYHHFPNKLQLGYAVVDEVIRGWIVERWVAPLETSADPIEGLRACIRRAVCAAPEEILGGGCPLNNLAQEMSSIDEGFRMRLDQVLAEWRGAVAKQLRRGQAAGTVRSDLAADAIASLLVSTFEGVAGTTKAARSRELATQMVDVMVALLDTLRPTAAVSAG